MNIMRNAIPALLCGLTLTSLSASAVEYPLPAANSRLVGQNIEYVVPADSKQPLEAIAAKYQIGLSGMMEANHGVDPYLPKPGSTLIIPQQLILPDTPHEGIVINVAEMRLYYYPKGKKTVEVLPVGIGQLGKDTPENWITSVQRKQANPTWTPTAKVHKEYAAMGEPLPAVVPAGPENPMGLFALYVGNLYAIHGTNASFGIGLRVSHGCIRLRNDDIKHLFSVVPVGTRVQFINQPVKATQEPDGRRYLEVHEPLSRTMEELNSTEQASLPMTAGIGHFIAKADTDSHVVKQALEDRTGLPVQINPQTN
ncbi:MAG: L,D-transpeptidase family protein [Tolumonas sp.]|nr:L,D-transpeptidase family protein [Tolumonas sp.]